MTLLRRYHLQLSAEVRHPSSEQVYGLLMQLLGPDLDRSGGGQKSISLAPLEPAEQNGCFQVGALSATMVTALDSLATATDSPVLVGDQAATVRTIRPLDPQAVSYGDLFDHAAPPRQLGLRFLSPAYIFRQREPVLFPDPAALFGAVLNRFNACSPFRFPGEVLDDLKRLRVLRYQLSTRTVHTPTQRISAFVGWIRYGVPGGFPPPMAYLASALCRFAQYSGVGSRTHLGFGQVILQEER